MVAPFGATSKFDVSYAWAAYFLRQKIRMLGPGDDLYRSPVEMDLRVVYNARSGLNIVPVDFAAKAILALALSDDAPDDCHIVNEELTPHSMYVPMMLETLNIRGVRRADSVPVDPNRLETSYYRTVGKIYTPYIEGEAAVFETAGIRDALRTSGLACPRVDRPGFARLMAFARQKHFGVEPPPAMRVSAGHRAPEESNADAKTSEPVV